MRYRLLFIIFLLIDCISCRELVQDEFTTEDSTPVINAILTLNNPVELQVSNMVSLIDTSIDLNNNANVYLYVNHTYAEQLSNTDNGLFTSDLMVEPENIYECRVVVNSFDDTISCADTIPTIPKIYNIEHINQAGVDDEGVAYPALHITFANNRSVTEYFEVEIEVINNGEETTASLEDITDPVLINEGLPLALFSNQLIDDTVYELTLNYTTGLQSSTSDGTMQTCLYPLIVYFRKVSYSYYQYMRSVYLYTQGRYPDGISSQTSVFNLYSNINNGYGIFAGYSCCQSDTIYPQ